MTNPPHIPRPGDGRDRDLPAPPPGMPYNHPAATPTMRKGRGKLYGAIAAGVLALCCVGGVVTAAVTSDTTDRTTTQQDDANRAAALAPSPSTTTTTPPPASTSSSPSAAPTTTSAKPTPTTPPPVLISDGTYLVGEDMPPGRYKVTERATELCYWARLDGDDPTDIIDNHIGGGFPQFTAKRGEQIDISSCPDFRKIK